MVSPPTEEIMRKRLMSVNSTQESVQTCSKWLLHHRESIDKIANCWMDIYKQTNDKLRIALIYVLNDVVQKAACKRDINVTLTFHPHLINATTISSISVKKAISRCVEVFGERNVYPAHIIEEMKTALGKYPIDFLDAEVSKISTEKDDSQNATEIDFQQLIRSIESFYKNEMLTEKAREILSRSSFNFKESVQGRVKDRNEGIKALSDMDSSRQKLLSFLDTVEKHKQKGLQLHEMMKQIENNFNLQLRDVTVINDAYERFAEGIKKTKSQLETMTSSGYLLGESPPRDAPSPTAGDDPFLHGVDGEELAGGGDDMEMDEELGGASSSRCFLKSANEYTRPNIISSQQRPLLNSQFIPMATTSIPPPRPIMAANIMDPRQARFFAAQQQQQAVQQQQQSSSIPPPPGVDDEPLPQQFFNQTNGGAVPGVEPTQQHKQQQPNLSSPPPLFNPTNPPPLIPTRTPKFLNTFNSSQPNFVLPPPGLIQPPALFSPQYNKQQDVNNFNGPKRRNSSGADSSSSKRSRNNSINHHNDSDRWKDNGRGRSDRDSGSRRSGSGSSGGGSGSGTRGWRRSFANGETRMKQYNRH